MKAKSNIKFPNIIGISGNPLSGAEHQEQKEDEKSSANLKTAIGLLTALEMSFSDIVGDDATYENLDSEGKIHKLPLKVGPSLEEKSHESIFYTKLEIKRESYPDFDIKVFALCEKEEIERILNNIVRVSKDSLDRHDPRYEKARDYIRYLAQVIDGQDKSESDSKLITLQSNLSDDQLRQLRKELIREKIIENINAEDFIYLLTGQPITLTMKQINWKHSKVKACVLLGAIVGKKFINSIANKCFVLAKNRKNKIFDSNVKATTGYPDIERILKTTVGLIV